MARKKNKPPLARLQCEIRQSTYDVLVDEADSEILPTAAIVRRVLDAYAARRLAHQKLADQTE